MLEIAPELTFGVLSPAFRGCEGGIALQQYAQNGCCFLSDSLCELHGTGFMPLECRFCHHLRAGLGGAVPQRFGEGLAHGKGSGACKELGTKA